MLELFSLWLRNVDIDGYVTRNGLQRSCLSFLIFFFRDFLIMCIVTPRHDMERKAKPVAFGGYLV